MLELRNITKDYQIGDEAVHALKGVSLAFREHEFVSILGQSGCGKTTMLNIIGGLDRYTDGDLIIGGRSTKYFMSADWDAYRNRRIGFVFQSYNLIPHLTVLGNVELALTLSGVSKSERTRRAMEALAKVGLQNEIHKRPNQMSGGQMQRVAIARAIVNDPDIILADEPTGALDSNTSVQVMEILKEISTEKLVIMVTHNRTLAETYSTRIVSMLDGNIIDDTSPVPFEEIEESKEEVLAEDVDKKTAQKQKKREQKQITKANKAAMKRTSMSFFTAFGLSARNLITKKGRTIMTAIAGSIGIIGVALVLALSHGFTNYIEDMEMHMLANYPITVTTTTADVESTLNNVNGGGVKREKFPDGTHLIIDTKSLMEMHYNRITQDYLDYVSDIPSGYCIDVTFDYAQNKPILSKNNGDAVLLNTGTSGLFSTPAFQPLMGNSDYVLSQYDVWGKYPTEPNELAVVVGTDNSINKTTLSAIGLKVPSDEDLEKLYFEDLMGQELKLVFNNEWYGTQPTDKGYFESFSSRHKPSDTEAWNELYDNANNYTLKVVGVMRLKESSALALYSTGMVYTPKLNELLLENSYNSEVAKAQRQNREMCVSDGMNMSMGDSSMQTAGMSFQLVVTLIKMSGMLDAYGIDITVGDLYEQAMQAVGASKIPSGINFYPANFDMKDKLKAYLNAYNDGKSDKDTIMLLDAAGLVTDTVGQIINIMTYVLVAFAAISLVVSSVMIGIITYASVVERTKEIGVLRAVGARKKDITRVFNAETMLIGLFAGAIGVLITFILSFPLSAIFKKISDGMVTTSLVMLAWWHPLMLIGISVFLTFIAGLIPAYAASKRDPVVALRTE